MQAFLVECQIRFLGTWLRKQAKTLISLTSPVSKSYFLSNIKVVTNGLVGIEQQGILLHP